MVVSFLIEMVLLPVAKMKERKKVKDFNNGSLRDARQFRAAVL